ncbi:DUF2790 domain-containing protein [Pseudomonas lalucatii]|uniref:DUF2790 domain-containing protein n=1 Tax=Pseudomonas lalucatii TaxID=1424203 RepID=A0ABS5Q5G3_9PSED|nr:DUF2790 domain-containing protein [Pseudomonas lalucatii]MBS7664011.1 DUF2790 domain-containing protein [Pseudomonas lalucatii]MBS7690808.1 DUF2790 domain-containing protein [Pseudomonas lalucatii]MBS7725372.1 DUF2790 domain-containing protein [Pseudomonas lalucatii]QVM86684.1 DUF2790 domain-containing protein [Pseudomonas lalucatii]
MKRLIPLVLGAAVGFAGAALAQPAQVPDASQVQAVDYHYGLTLDVHKVIDITDNSDKTGVVPATITYLDSQGRLHKVNYLELGRANDGN